jgi:hypothetical protein
MSMTSTSVAWRSQSRSLLDVEPVGLELHEHLTLCQTRRAAASFCRPDRDLDRARHLHGDDGSAAAASCLGASLPDYLGIDISDL